jgi:hypothetical protein
VHPARTVRGTDLQIEPKICIPWLNGGCEKVQTSICVGAIHIGILGRSLIGARVSERVPRNIGTLRTLFFNGRGGSREF